MCSRPQFTDLAYMGGTGLCGPMTIIFDSVIKTEYKSLSIKFGVNRAFHVLNPQFIDLTYMGGTRTCGPTQLIFNTNQCMGNRSLDAVIRCSMCSRPQFTDLTYIGGTRLCGSVTIIFDSVIWSQYTSLTIKFGVNRPFHVLKTPVYRFGLYERYRTLWTDDDNFWQYYLELVYKPNFQIWCESSITCAQDPSLPIWLIWEVPDPVDR